MSASSRVGGVQLSVQQSHRTHRFYPNSNSPLLTGGGSSPSRDAASLSQRVHSDQTITTVTVGPSSSCPLGSGASLLQTPPPPSSSSRLIRGSDVVHNSSSSMAASCPSVLSNTIDKVFADSIHTANVDLSSRNLEEFPEATADLYDLVDTLKAGTQP